MVYSYTLTVHKNCFIKVKAINSGSNTNTGDKGLSLYYPRLLHCLDQMLAATVLSQHWVSSSRTIRPPTPYHAQCRLMGTLLRRGLQFFQWHCTRNLVKKRDSIVLGKMKPPNTSLQVIDLNPILVCRRLILVEARPFQQDWYWS